jgi:hypothetical protein
MYSKIALDLYEELLEKVGSPIQFVKEAAFPQNIVDWFRKLRGPASAATVSSKVTPEMRDAFTKMIRDQGGVAGRTSVLTDIGDMNKIYDHLARVTGGVRSPNPGEIEEAVKAYRGSVGPEMAHVNLDKLIEGVHEVAPEHLGIDWKKNPSNVLALGAAAATVPAYYLGKRVQGAGDEWDKLKYGLGGLGVGLASPFVYNALKNNNLGALSSYLPGMSDQQNQQAISDFTSI